MTTANRATPRSPGRTPPFILVGLLVILGFLAFSYWRLSSTNSQLSAELESLEIQKKEIDKKNADVEKNIESANEELRSTQGKLEQLRKSAEDKDAEIKNLKADLSSKQADIDKTKNLLSQCDASVAEQKSSLETLKNEKAELEKQLNEAKQNHPVCDIAGCTAPIREVLNVAAKLVGSDALGKVLTEAKFDAGKLLEGIQVPAPQEVKVEEPKKDEPQKQQAQNPADVKQQNAPV
ncbi:unnamed protein product, partial [Candidula unifasciata]